MRNIEVIVNNRLEDYQYLEINGKLYCNKNTAAWLLLGFFEYDYSKFFKQWSFEKALNYSARAAKMIVNKRIDDTAKALIEGLPF